MPGGRTRNDHRGGDEDYSQAGYLYRLMDDEQKRQLIANLASALRPAPMFVQVSKIGHFCKADPECGKGVAAALGIAMHEVAGVRMFGRRRTYTGRQKGVLRGGS